MEKKAYNPKIIHCPTTVGGNPQGLSEAEKSLGLDSHSITLSTNYLNYPADEIIYRKGASLIENELRRWCALVKTLIRADVIHYNFGETLAPAILMYRGKKYAGWKLWLYNNLYARWLEFIDLRLARLFGKIITVTYQGDDARQGDYCRANYPLHFSHEIGETYYTPETDTDKRRRIKIFDKHAHFIYAVNPDLMNVLPERAKFVPYASVDPKDWKVVTNKNDVPHVVHAPSHRGVKGTQYIADAVERLKAEGIPFRFTLVEGLSNQEARKIYESADLLIDQLLAGYYGALAVELMALGKPVICYLRQEDFHHMPAEMEKDIPVIDATPDTIYDVLKLWLTDKKDHLPELGIKGRAYVEKWHDPVKIAQSINDDVMTVMNKRGK